jgi:hypothetical protein
VRARLNRHPRVTLHFTLSSDSWLDPVDAFFSVIPRQALRCGSLSPQPTSFLSFSGSSTTGRPLHPFTWAKDPTR